MTTTISLDERDQQILADRIAAYSEIAGPRCGDWVVFADGVERRISHIWDFGDDDRLSSVQTSEPFRSYYFGDRYVSYSGSLYGGVHPSTLTATGETSYGSVWFFHHDFWGAGRGVDTTAPFRVYRCTEEATS